ncbi:MAG TPA: phospho-N-acetylmuramoyl-pentapeptide-transferase [Flavobacteriales bacterium]|nr:phospho-N-acetylmuramoyl-pentapeptide-transferase [Flavobacteriales bacterium]HRE74984.1 phospho-N-acetylmuramoyl-pentapeptide-transferase [Flavobacteriales bacterium]HRE95390.1 phospho-N-acetylmuramoyl-pentapeptide-transferase [Flavobacteriales bacterium]HRJ36797.1 phospho-N-acetylmuramoyl-pentapeptide-transferase [Flavobacteriales bacterium]HRJ38096.1 phospho-N-acetylmuramoyl-pentapeptide-transferase [Flavobacteriales bacterium]
MLYYLFSYLDEMDFPGAGVFHYISFRAAMAIITSLIISMLFGKRLINYLQYKQVGETIRDLGLQGQMEKKGTPTMGGIIILMAILIPTLLFAKLQNIYVILMIVSTVWLGTIGFIDDYIKVFKKDKKGLAGKFKILGQLGIGLIVGFTLYFHQDVKIKEKVAIDPDKTYEIVTEEGDLIPCSDANYVWKETRSLKTTIPFVKNNEFDYSWISGSGSILTMVLFVLIVIVIVTAVSNGANITDGLDGLATGTSAIIGTVLAIFAYLSGNLAFADYLNIMYIPDSGELVVFIAAFVGACIGFLWYNAYPAQVFMGDTGSLALGGIIAVFSIAIRKELLIPIFCGVFLIENLSVMMQVSYFKYTRKKYGEGRRIFLMSPLHHHYQKKGMHESKIVARFWIVGIMLAVVSIVTLKLR